MIELINEFGLYRYRYDRARSGCLYWCKTVLNVLILQNFVAPGTLERFQELVDQSRLDHANSYQIPEDRGSFLDEHGAVVRLPVEPQ